MNVFKEEEKVTPNKSQMLKLFLLQPKRRRFCGQASQPSCLRRAWSWKKINKTHNFQIIGTDLQVFSISTLSNKFTDMKKQ